MIPIFITFADPEIPVSLSVVDPYDLERHFGPGYHLKGMWLEMTNDPASGNVIAVFSPWLGDKEALKIADGRLRMGLGDGYEKKRMRDIMRAESTGDEAYFPGIGGVQ